MSDYMLSPILGKTSVLQRSKNWNDIRWTVNFNKKNSESNNFKSIQSPIVEIDTSPPTFWNFELRSNSSVESSSSTSDESISENVTYLFFMNFLYIEDNRSEVHMSVKVSFKNWNVETVEDNLVKFVKSGEKLRILLKNIELQKHLNLIIDVHCKIETFIDLGANSIIKNPENKKSDDLMIIIDNKAFNLNSELLISESKKFENLILEHKEQYKYNSSYIGMVISDLSIDQFEDIIQFLYHRKIEFKDIERMALILNIAKNYEFDSLKRYCEIELCKNLNSSNFVRVLSFSIDFNCRILKKFCLNFIRDNISFIVNTNAYEILKSIFPELICDLICTLHVY